MEEKTNVVNESNEKVADKSEEIAQDINDEVLGEGTPAFVERKRWLFFGLPFTFTKYIIRDDVLTIDRGLLKTMEDDCYMYKIIDVKLEVSLVERMAGLGTVLCYTSDSTDKVIRLEHIKHSRQVKNHILAKSEKMRMKRRTLNTLNLNSDISEDIDVE